MMSKIYLKISECSEAIYYVNLAIKEYKLVDEQVLPLELIKAKSFERLGDKESSRECYRRIAKINPNYNFSRRKL